jgi:hypothetical protein
MPSAKLPTHQAAIDRDNRARHIVREVGRQELNDFGAVLNGPEPPKSDQLGPITIALDATRSDCRQIRAVAMTPGAMQARQATRSPA